MGTSKTSIANESSVCSSSICLTGSVDSSPKEIVVVVIIVAVVASVVVVVVVVVLTNWVVVLFGVVKAEKCTYSSKFFLKIP